MDQKSRMWTLRDLKCPNENKCISNEFLCNGYEDCSNGGDEKQCQSSCGSARYLTATNQAQLLQSRTYRPIYKLIYPISIQQFMYNYFVDFLLVGIG